MQDAVKRARDELRVQLERRKRTAFTLAQAGHTFAEIGGMLGISRQRAEQLVKQARVEHRSSQAQGVS